MNKLPIWQTIVRGKIEQEIHQLQINIDTLYQTKLGYLELSIQLKQQQGDTFEEARSRLYLGEFAAHEPKLKTSGLRHVVKGHALLLSLIGSSMQHPLFYRATKLLANALAKSSGLLGSLGLYSQATQQFQSAMTHLKGTLGEASDRYISLQQMVQKRQQTLHQFWNRGIPQSQTITSQGKGISSKGSRFH